MKKLMITVLAVVLVLYVAIAAFMYVSQRKFQYFPQASLSAGYEPVSAYALEGFEDVTITPADGETLKAWYGAPPKPGGLVILYLHGNAGTLSDRVERFRLFRNEGYGVLVISWRGFGGSTGFPSEAGLILDGQGAISFLKDRGIMPDRLVVFGESLGSGVAVQIGAHAQTRPAAIILDSPYYSMLALARSRYGFLPVSLLLKDQFRSGDFAPKVTSPVFVLHGTVDTVVPFAEGRRLFDVFTSPKNFHEIPGGGHVVPLTPESWGAIKSFLNKHGL